MINDILLILIVYIQRQNIEEINPIIDSSLQDCDLNTLNGISEENQTNTILKTLNPK